MKDFTSALGMVLVAICVSALIAAPVACNHNDNDAIQKLTEGGADPIAARCAVSASSTPDMCLAYVARSAK